MANAGPITSAPAMFAEPSVEALRPDDGPILLPPPMPPAAAPPAPPMFAEPSVEASRRDDGAIVLRSRMPLAAAARCTGDWLEHWARTVPDRTFLAERRGDTWTLLTYGETRTQVRAAAAWMLAQGLGPDRPLAILSDNSIAHAVLSLAAQHIGVA